MGVLSIISSFISSLVMNAESNLKPFFSAITIAVWVSWLSKGVEDLSFLCEVVEASI